MVVDLIALGAFTLVAAIFLRASRRMKRIEGAVLLAGYAAFMIALM
jgi:hypothetical protein